MAVPEWLFGPAGDLRPLPSPEGDVVNSVERFGGVHHAVNGGRTVDTLGFRANYEFELPYLDPEDFFRLEALYMQTDPRQLWLVDPLRRNMLSREASLGKTSDTPPFSRGLTAWNGDSIKWPRIADTPVSWQQRGGLWSGIGEMSRLSFDYGTHIPVHPGKTMTFSVYLYASEEMTVRSNLISFADGTESGNFNGDELVLPAMEWTRYESSFTISSSVSEVIPDLYVVSNVTEGSYLKLVAPQFELGASPSGPALGGGSVRVVIDHMDTTSPRYPLQSVSLSLLEV